MAKVYNKLVRDNIIDIIQKDGRKADYEVLNDARYSKALEKKLGEEYKEYIDDPCLEEMCDIIEVIDAICKVKGYTKEQIEEKRKSKCKTKGAFEKRLYLKKVED